MRHVAEPANGWEVRHVGFEARTEVDDEARIVGYPVVFGVRSLDLGGFTEFVRPSAVDRSLRDGADIRAYFNHDSSYVLGRTTAGTLALKKDKRGLQARIYPPDTTFAKDLMKSITRGDISGMSFRFRTIEDDWHMEAGQPVRELIDFEMGEISVVSEPAYVDTSVAVRSLGAFQTTQRGRGWYERRLRAAGIR